MAEVVFVLGAGASVESGAPVMTNFLDVAEDLLRSDQCGDDKASFEHVFKCIAALKSVHAQLALDTNNLETVFSAFEMGAMVGRLGTLTSADEIARAMPAMARLITRTLMQTVRFPVRDRSIRAPWAYENFVSLLQRIKNPTAGTQRAARGPKGISSVITLNYDLALDYALYREGMQPAYWLSDEMHPSGSIKVLKLHGSLNWGRCRCGKVAPWNLVSFFQNRGWNLNLLGVEPIPSMMLNIPDLFQNFQHGCGAMVGGDPVVVPPTWNKTNNQLLQNVWRHAANELSEARYVVFIGYSFPDTDLYFRYLLALGLAGDTRIRRIIVVDPDPGPAEKLTRMLGVGVKQRLEVVQDGFSKSVGKLVELLEVGDRKPA
jgi:hypothetical protein